MSLNVDINSDISYLYQFNQNVLGIIEYGIEKKVDTELSFHKLPYQFIQVENIDKNTYEIWYTNEDVIYKKYGNCMEAKSAHYCFRTIYIDNSDGNYLQNAERVNNEILKKIDFNTYRVVRLWNYIPGIIASVENGEHYKEFCAGRERAFENFYKENGEVYPAATGIGSKGKNLCLILLAIHIDSTRYSIENPRQVPAYQYPSKYGASSPKFSRATYIQYKNQKALLLSGTASIVGADSVHEGDIINQLHTTISNIRCLFGKENLTRYSIFDECNEMNLRYLKVYIKNWDDYSIIKSICEKYFEKEKIIYMQSDICRKELLVEIEGVWI